MKTKAQKSQELEKAKGLLAKSTALVFADFTKLTAENMRRLRRELKAADAELLVIKKRLLGVLFKERGIDVDLKQHKFSVGAIFAKDGIEKASGVMFKFLKDLKLEKEKIVGGYNVSDMQSVSQKDVIFIGGLPPREVLLAQLLGMMSTPIRSFLYILSEKSKQGEIIKRSSEVTNAHE